MTQCYGKHHLKKIGSRGAWLTGVTGSLEEKTEKWHIRFTVVRNIIWGKEAK